jgi:hypothetical protein
VVEGEQQQFANQKMQHSGFGQDDTLVASTTKPFGGAAEEKDDEQKRWHHHQQGKPDMQVDDNKIIGKPDSQPTRGWRPDGNE